MTKKALELLNKNNTNGFFFVIEGSRIDHCGHNNDIYCHYREVWAYNEAFRIVKEFAEKDENTLIVSTADHETGGLTLGRDVDGGTSYAFYPSIVEAVQKSTEYMASTISSTSNYTFVAEMLAQFGLPNLSTSEYSLLNTFSPITFGYDEIINRRARIGFTTRGHTGVDVNVYSYGPGSQKYYGNKQNTQLGQIIADLMGFNLSEITTKLS